MKTTKFPSVWESDGHERNDDGDKGISAANSVSSATQRNDSPV